MESSPHNMLFPQSPKSSIPSALPAFTTPLLMPSKNP